MAVFQQDGSLFTSGNTTIVTGNGSGTSGGTIDLTNIALGSHWLSLTGGDGSATNVTDGTDTTLTIVNSTLAGDLFLTNSAGAITTQNYGSTSNTPAVITLSGTPDIGVSAVSGISLDTTGNVNYTELDGGSTSALLTNSGNLKLTTGGGGIGIATLSATATGTLTGRHGQCRGHFVEHAHLERSHDHDEQCQ